MVVLTDVDRVSDCVRSDEGESEYEIDDETASAVAVVVGDVERV
jgi:hypothetical protein